jgi:serine/threonine-protein kinase HipA
MPKLKSFTKAYVFAQDANQTPVLAGTLESDGSNGIFAYADSWLAESWTYPLDPVNLPLHPKRFLITNKKGVHGVFSDAGPDDWGTRIMLMHNNSAPANELERLMRTSGGGVGCLRFSGSRSRPKTPKPLPSLTRIQELVEIVERAQGRDVLTDEELALIDPGSSMGGARPKVSCQDDNGGRWLVKLSRKGEIVDMPRLEYAAMTFCATHLGVITPECRLLELGNGQAAFMIRRFDEHAHFISAHGLINQDRARQIQDSKANPYSYVSIASLLRKHATHFEADCRQLFTRLVANIVMGNTDDHARNHAMLYDIPNRTWGLSPAYDMLPSINGTVGKQALGVGKMGSDSTIENALSYATLFMLKQPEAQAIVDSIQDAFKKHWDDHLQNMGVTPADRQIISRFVLADNPMRT